MLATENGHERIVNYVISLGAYVNVTTQNHHTALMFAAENGQCRVVQEKIDHEADVSVVDDSADGIFAGIKMWL